MWVSTGRTFPYLKSPKVLRARKEIRAAKTIFHVSGRQAGIGLLVLRLAVGFAAAAVGILYLSGSSDTSLDRW